MNRINKMLSSVKQEAAQRAEQRELKELDAAFEKMTAAQLYEFIDGNPTEERIKEIFASVGALHLLESG